MATAALQKTPDGETASGPAGTVQLQLVSFELAGECFAVDIHAVREINRLIELTRVPKSPEEIAGVINLRGKIFPVVNLRRKFGFADAEAGEHTRIIVLEFGGRETGFIVDRVHEVLRIDSSIMDPTPEVMGSVDTDFIRGIAKLADRLLIVLDLERLFGALRLPGVEPAEEAA
jgi:purine-binding chemotaxis protein CheW